MKRFRSINLLVIALTAFIAVSGCTAPVSFRPNFLGNSAETQFCAWPSNWAICGHARGASDEAYNQQSLKYGPQSVDGNKPNAFLHATWHALMTNRMSNNPATAIGFGQRHEAAAPHIPDAVMDLHNNEVGAWVGAQAPTESDSINFCKWLADNAAWAGGTNPPSGPDRALWHIR